MTLLNHPQKAPRVAATALALLFATLLGGCDGSMEPKECDKLRGEAFDLLNKAQQCNNDADCRQSTWPGCAKPVSNKTFEKIKGMADKYKAGKCEEPPSECKKPPESYCKQGLCVHREKAMPQGRGAAPADKIQVQ